MLFDDFRAKDYPFNLLLKLLDRYDTTYEFKGGSGAWLPQTIIITCPRHPQAEYTYWRGSKEHEEKEHEDIQQLLRRITEIRAFGISGAAEQELLNRRAEGTPCASPDADQAALEAMMDEAVRY